MAVGVSFPNLIENNVRIAHLNPNSLTFSTEMDVQVDSTGGYTTTVSTNSNSLQASIIDLNGQDLGPGSLVPATGSINLHGQTLPYIATLRIDGAVDGKLNYSALKDGDSNFNLIVF